jgi:hypothetical protein
MHLRLISLTTLAFPLLVSACSDSEGDRGILASMEGTNPLNPGEEQPTDGMEETEPGASGAGNEGSDPNLPLQGQDAALTGVEVPGAGCSVGALPEFADLTENAAFPSPFMMQDGTAVTTKAQWACRHRELRAMFEKYETGPKTEKPAEVTGSVADGTLTVNVSDGAGRTASFNVTITYPASGGSGPFPAMIGLGGGSLNNARLQEQGVATINFPVNDVRPEGNRGAGAFTAFTGQMDSGSLIAWAWGVSRVIDALEGTPEANIKADKLGITGCSRLGKGALMVGAMDSRIALTIPQESGSGGTAAWRAAEAENQTAPQGCETPADLTRCVQKLSSTYTETQWFGTSIAQFASAVDRLPVDHHQLIALGAPRGMLALGNIGWRWLGRYGTVQGMSGAREVYRALAAEQSIGYVESGHFHCNNMDFAGREQAAIDAFVAKFLLDQDVSTDFWDQGVAFEAERWVNWESPVLE